MGNCDSMNVNHWDESRFEYVQQQLAIAIKSNNQVIVSVGSGDGEQEQRLMNSLEQENSTRELICVDNISYDLTQKAEMIMPPQYPTVNELITARPTIVGDCILLLFWPYDKSRHDPKNPYDVEAIIKLKPCQVIILYEEFGGAGSDKLHHWLLESGAETTDMCDEPISYGLSEKAPRYQLIGSKKWHYGTSNILHISEKSFIIAHFTSDTQCEVLSIPRFYEWL
jgi:hypothetical protein